MQRFTKDDIRCALVAFSIGMIMLFAFILSCHAQEQKEEQAQVFCVATSIAEQVNTKLAVRPGLTLIELKDDEFRSFMKFLLDNGVSFDGRETEFKAALLIEISARANAGPPRTSFVLIRNEEPAYCSSSSFNMSPEAAQHALEAIYGRKS